MLGDVAEFINGVAFKPEDWGDTGARIIRIQNLNDPTKPYNRTVRQITDKFHVYPGDILVSWSASLGVFEWEGPDVGLLNQHIFRVLPDPNKVEKRYLRHALELALMDMQRHLHGATMMHVNRGEFLATKLYLPPLPEQRRIAAILDKADALRAKRREALAQLQELTQSIFIEMFGVYSPGRSPWPVELFAQLTEHTKIGLVRGAGEFGQDFDVPYVRMNALGRAGEFYPQLVLKTNVSPNELEEFSLKPGDLLFNTRNSKELVGKTALFKEEGDFVFNNNLMRIRFRQGVEPVYVAAAFLTPFIQKELEIRKAGTTNVFAIYAKELKTLPIPLPPFIKQQEYRHKVEGIERLKKPLISSCDYLDSLFSSLQHRAFRGEL
jgi:type I restriction enzyme S subunit